MFGFVVADRSALTQEQALRYQSCYCGLCRVIGRRFGTVQRLALNYDMTFLVLLLSSLYEPQEQQGCSRCAVHPVKPRQYQCSEITEYAAAMNMALAYHNCMDNWHDDRSLVGLAEAAVFRKSALQAAEEYPRQWKAIEACLKALSEIEAMDDPIPDSGANAFGALMGELFVWKQDRWEPLLRQLGEALGRFVYLMDAVTDLDQDRKKHRYNPLLVTDDGRGSDAYRPMLAMHMGECSDAFERLPLVQDAALLRNILYSGVWTRLDGASGRRQGNV